MAQDKTFSQRWDEYRPSKGLLLWSFIGAIVLTMVVGFTAGGWVTGGTANAMAEEASRNTRAELVASLCVNKFVTAVNADGRLAKLKDASSYKRDDMIKDGGWLKIAGIEDAGSDAADLCAEKLVSMKELPARVVQPASPTAETTTDG